MKYTVIQLSELSGISVRTLHYYDEIKLLKPAFTGANGYRYYEQEQLLRLQQILFYRELGFELKKIRMILDKADFDILNALESHRVAVQREFNRQRRLIQTIDQTISYLKGNKSMQSDEIFKGFDPVEQKKHEQYLVDRYGDGMREPIAESNAKVKDWTKNKWSKVQSEFAHLCHQMVQLMEDSNDPDAAPVQAIVRQHFHWICQFWTPNRESYQGYSQLIVDSDLRKAFEAYHPDLPDFFAKAVVAYSIKDLE